MKAEISINMLSKLLNSALVFFVSIFIVKNFGNAQLGDFVTYQAIVTLLQPVTMMGLSGYLLKYAPVNGNKYEEKEYIKEIITAFILLSFVFLTLIFIIFESINYFSQTLERYEPFFPFFILSTLAMSMVMLLQTICALYRKFYRLAILNVIIRTFLIITIFLFYYRDLFDYSFNFNGIQAYHLDFVSSIATLTFLLFYLFSKGYFVGCISTMRKTMVFSLKFWFEIKDFLIIAFIHVANSSAGILIAYYTQDKSDLGELGLAMRFMMPVVLMLSIANNFTASKFKLAYKKGGAVQVIALSRSLSKKFLPISIFLLTLITLFIYPFSSYLDLELGVFWDCIFVLIVGYIINITYLASGNVLIVIGDESIERKILSISVVVNILATLILTPFLGVVSVAIGQSLAMILVNLLTDIHARKHYHSSIFPLAR